MNTRFQVWARKDTKEPVLVWHGAARRLPIKLVRAAIDLAARNGHDAIWIDMRRGEARRIVKMRGAV